MIYTSPSLKTTAIKIQEDTSYLTSVVLSFLPCALPLKLRDENDKEESHVKVETSNPKVVISGEEGPSSLPALTDTPRKYSNVPSDYNRLIRENDASAARPVEAAPSKYGKILPQRAIEVAAVAPKPKDFDRITYDSAKETRQTRDGIRRESSNVSRIFESPAVTQSTAGEEADTKKSTEARDGLASVDKPTHVPVDDDVPIPLTDARNNTPREAESFREREANEGRTRLGDSSAGNLTAENRDAEEDEWRPGEDDHEEAANFGLRAMRDLYRVQEPKLYSMGLYLGSDEPARYVAAFNDQSEEARDLARFGYAALQGTTMFLKRFPGAPLELPSSRSTRRTLLGQQCPRRGTPQCPPASLRYRTSDGSCNNLQNLWWGSAMSAMQRFLPAVYNDGVQSVRRSKNGRALPTARDITSSIHEDKDIPLSSVTHMLMQWGQFVDHDLTATGQSRGFNGTIPQCCLPGGVGFQPPEFMHPECLPIAVNLRDSFYGPLGVRCLEFLRSGPAPREGCEFGAREQLSQVTSYLDASMVYSSNAFHSDSLRIFRNGLLQYGKIQTRRPMLPKFESDLCRRGSLSTNCFRAGDGRLSEQPALTSLHIVFLRLHNRIATELSALNPHWSDEKLFQETRRIVGAVIQHVTYREFLPIVLGPQVMKIFDLEVLKKGYYEGYDPTVNPTIANAFTTAAYRFGHSLVQPSFVRFDSEHRPLFNNVSIHEEFSNPANLETAGSVDRLLLGLVNQPCQRRDEFITEEITNHLFQTPGFAFGMDLASINIQRGRDHGLPPYVKWREPCGLSPIRSFDDLERIVSPSAARTFRSLYSSVEDIDLYTAGLAEKSVIGGLVGPTFACIIAQQFGNLRRGDRFWYENPGGESSFTAGQLQQIRHVTLAQVLCKTIDSIETVQPFVLLSTDVLNNRRLSCDDPAIGQLSLEFWAEQPLEARRDKNDSRRAGRTASGSNAESANAKGAFRRSRKKNSTARPNPFKNTINQNNNIVVKRPFGRPDNVTIVVQNHAVNSPIFLNEGLYGSHVRIPIGVQVRPTSDRNRHPPSRPHVRPTPTTHSTSFSHASRPYVPHAFDDPSNPNPLSYGFRSPAAGQDGVIYDNYEATSPRPTLYTYYTSFQQKPATTTTQLPHRDIDGYLINHASHHERDSLPVTSAYKRPTPTPTPTPTPMPTPTPSPTPTPTPSYGDAISSTSARPSYASSVEPHRTRQKPNHKRRKPTSSTSPRPSNESHHAQKPIYAPSTSSRPSHRPQGAQRPTGRPHLQNDNGNPTTGSYANSNKAQSSTNAYQSGQPNERPYDNDDPDIYHKRPNVKLQGSSTFSTGASAYPKETIASTSPYSTPTYSQSTVASHNYDRHDATATHQTRPTSTQSGWTAVSYGKEPYGTRAPQIGDSPSAHGSPSHQKKRRPTPQKSGQSSSSHSKESLDRPPPTAATLHYPSEQSNFYQIPTRSPGYDNPTSFSAYAQQNSRPTAASYRPETSTNKPQAQESNFSSRPKVQSVTIVTDPSETIHHPGHSGYVSQHKISEIPRPLAPPTKSDTPVIRTPGQYYYEKNVLYRYPDRVTDQIPKSNDRPAVGLERTPLGDRGIPSEAIAAQTAAPTADDRRTAIDPERVRGEESKSTTPTRAIGDRVGNNDNNTDDAVDDLEDAFSADVESVATDVPDRMNHWTKPQEDPNLPLSLEMPGITSVEFAQELPKPIKSRSRGT